MHNVNTDALEQTIANALQDPSTVVQQVNLDGEWNPGEGPQFRATIPFPGGETTFEADFPPPMGGSGTAPNSPDADGATRVSGASSARPVTGGVAPVAALTCAPYHGREPQ
jgi:hypothetical protein